MNQTQHLTTNNTHLQTWVSREFKERFAQAAKAQGMSESALLRRLLEKVFLTDQSREFINSRSRLRCFVVGTSFMAVPHHLHKIADRILMDAAGTDLVRNR